MYIYIYIYIYTDIYQSFRGGGRAGRLGSALLPNRERRVVNPWGPTRAAPMGWSFPLDQGRSRMV